MKLPFPVASFVVFALIAFCLSCEPKKTEEQPLVEDLHSGKVMDPDFTGRLYTSGLSQEEAERLQLAWPVYQITGAESYFFSGHDSLQLYLGKCVGVVGEVLDGWKGAETINGQFTYNREALQTSKILLQPLAACPDSEVAEEHRMISGTLNYYQGIPLRMVRPAPDIAYDYALRLHQPFRDEFNQVEPNKLITEIPIEVYEPEELNKIEKALQEGKGLEVKAALVHAYAESPVLQVVKLKEVE